LLTVKRFWVTAGGVVFRFLIIWIKLVLLQEKGMNEFYKTDRRENERRLHKYVGKFRFGSCGA